MERKLDYSKLWKLLVDKKMSKAALRKAIEISPNTLTKLRKEEVVSMEVILKICDYLDCDISDIVEYKWSSNHFYMVRAVANNYLINKNSL